MKFITSLELDEQPNASIYFQMIIKKNRETIPPQLACSADRYPELTNGFLSANKLPIFVITLLTIVLYIQTIGFDYVLDDTMVIVKNQFTQRGINGIGDIFKYESFRGYFGEQKKLLEGDRYRPLSIATFAIEKSVFEGSKEISHFINILLYALTGSLVFRVLLFMFPNGDSKKWYLSIPFMATMLFIAHPLHVEVVANIKGRDEIIAFMGEIASLYFSFKYIYKNKKIYLIGSFVAFLIAILSKESAITFLAIVPLTLHFFTKATFSEKIKSTIPIALGTALYLFMRIKAIGYLLGSAVITDVMNNPFYGMPFAEKTATIFYTLLLYLKLLVFPHPLTHDYYPYQIPKMTWGDWQPVFSLLIYVFLIVIILRGVRFNDKEPRKVAAYCAAFYLITLSIVSNLFVSVGTFMNERFVYHASLGFCVALAYFLSKNDRFLIKNINYGTLALGIIISIFSIKTLIRVPDWRNNSTLNHSAIQYSPNSARANCFYAVSIWEDTYSKLPKESNAAQRKIVLDSMKPYFEKSVSILPNYSAAQKMRAMVAIEYHKIDNDFDALLKILDEVNRSRVYEPSILKYLKEINNQVNDTSTAEKLRVFYTQMIAFFNTNYPSSIMPSEYTNLLNEIQTRAAQ
jgi:protein O-mannosyl-transferase